LDYFAARGLARAAGLAHGERYLFGASLDRSGKFAYIANLISDDVSTYTIDSITGRVLAGDGPGAIGIVGTTP
jgi:hypothetical protein